MNLKTDLRKTNWTKRHTSGIWVQGSKDMKDKGGKGFGEKKKK